MRDLTHVVIFDGLDEVLVHYGNKAGQDIIRELWQILEQSNRGFKGKMLLSCRTHYFPSVTAQNHLFTGHGRELAEAMDYRGIILLPWQTAQIKNYLANNLATIDSEAAWDLLCAMHDLHDLATRPYTLELIARHILALEQQRLAGKELLSCDLYQLILDDWLARDDGKHQLTKPHKISLTEQLAHELWQTRSRVWNNQQLDDWLMGYFWQQTHWHSHYGINPNTASGATPTLMETFKEDLRTATFIVRSQGDGFRFAHTSMQEYFLARHLYHALANGDIDVLAGQPMSQETWQFYGEYVVREGLQSQLASWEKLRQQYLPEASEQGFLLNLYCWQHALPHCPFHGWQLGHADFFELRVDNPKSNDPLVIRNSSFSQANLSQGRWQGVVFDACDFSHSQLRQTEFLDCQGRYCQFIEADMNGAAFRSDTASAWQHCNFSSTKQRHAQWLSPLQHKKVFTECRWAGDTNVTSPAPTHPPFKKTHAVLSQTDGHAGVVTHAIVHNNTIISTSDDKTLKIWDPISGRCIHTLTGHKGTVLHAIAHNNIIISASDDNTLKIWDPISGQCIRTLAGHSNWVIHATVHNNAIISASDDSTLKIWDAISGQCIHTLTGHMGPVNHASAHNNTIISASYDNTLKIWESITGQCIQTLTGHSDSVNHAITHKNTIISASDDKTLKIWDPISGHCIQTLIGHTESVLHAIVHDNTIISASDDKTLKIWDPISGHCIHTLTGHLDSVLHVITHNNTIISASYDNTLKIWNPISGQCIQTLTGHSSTVRHAIINVNNTIISTSDDNTLKIWNPISGQCTLTLTGHSRSVLLAIPHNSTIVSTSLDNTPKIWDAKSGQCIHTLTEHSHYVLHAIPHNNTIISASIDKTLKIWDAISGQCIQTLTGHTHFVNYVIAHDNIIISASYDNTLKIWDAKSGQCINTLTGHSHFVNHAIAHNNTIISASYDATLKIWDAITGRCIHTLIGHSGPVLHAIVHNNNIISASYDNTLKIWNPISGQCIYTLTGHMNAVNHAIAHNNIIISASEDSILKIWDTISGQCLATVSGHTGIVQQIQIEKDDSYLIYTLTQPNLLSTWRLSADFQHFEEVMPRRYLQRQQATIIDHRQQRVLAADDQAWREFSWVETTDENGNPIALGEGRLLPLEAFGAIPRSNEDTSTDQN